MDDEVVGLADLEGDQAGRGPVAGTARRPTRLHGITFLVLAVGLVATLGLSAAAFSVHDSNENRLLRQRAREASAELVAGLPSLDTGLAATARLVQAIGGNAATFKALFSSLTAHGKPFTSASIWLAGGDETQPLVVLGQQPALLRVGPAALHAFMQRAAGTDGLAVETLLDAPQPTVGYAVVSPPGPQRYIVYAETILPKDRLLQKRNDAVFAGLAYAAYLGRAERTPDLLGASTASVPLRGRRATVIVPYGDTYLYLVVSPTHDQGGFLLELLPWLIGGVGLAISVSFALLAERLLRRQEFAEALARDNAVLYADQRLVAETLQRSLLPQELPDAPGMEFAAHYQPGVAGIEVGGDWYDVWLVGDHVLLVVGDVSGRGLQAAAIMASLRYAIRAYAAQGDDPAEILAKLCGLLDIEREGHFATILCAQIELGTRRLTVANAGHPNPLLLDGETGHFVVTSVGPPIGVDPAGHYQSTTFEVPPRATLLAFTDGLFERRGEIADAGMDRVLAVATRGHQRLRDLLPSVCRELIGDGAHDDTAILGVRWRG